MPKIDRRTMLYAFGAASISPLFSVEAQAAGRVAVCKPGESRFPYASAHQAKLSPCKLTSDDSHGVLSMFELSVGPRAGPVRHVHRREDEWCYVAAGNFVFEIGEEKFQLPIGGSVWMPRDIPHVWANVASTGGKLIVGCQPGGFEKFFDELGKIPEAEANNPARVKQVMAAFGMELLGPPLFGVWRQQR